MRYMSGEGVILGHLQKFNGATPVQSCMNPELYQKLNFMVFQFVISNLSATTAKNCAVNIHQLSLKKS